MAVVKFYSDTDAHITAKAVENGSIYIAYDTHKMYMDFNGGRFEIGEMPSISWGDIEDVPTDLVYTDDLTSVVADEASERQAADSALQTGLDTKLELDNISGGTGITVTKDEASNSLTIDSTVSGQEEIVYSATEPADPTVKLWIKV